MSNSWLIDNNVPTGFVYYNLDSTPSDSQESCKDTSSFLEFRDDSPSSPQFPFNPSSFSSPNNRRNYNSRGFNKKSHRYNQSFFQKQFHSNVSNGNLSFNKSRSRDYSNGLNGPWIKNDNGSFQKNVVCTNIMKIVYN